ncbi:putative transposase (plasmid) [Cupriavidus necator H16]|uniref:Putative transposase n=1 Tax=Cupriavidus necator (strain ATCC 17699 / DSM 428 / KCTC 22496 / NCIMB 10442 / H16 / Stanier 337) TaxID=381666 RepID=Q7WXC6_CUPNH|nr:putative transposase [Cupriavidus necator H16]
MQHLADLAGDRPEAASLCDAEQLGALYLSPPASPVKSSRPGRECRRTRLALVFHAPACRDGLYRGGLRRPRHVHYANMNAPIADLSRFAHPRQLMAWLGVTPSEHSSGDKRRQGSITKNGNSYARKLLVEAARSYRYLHASVPRSSAGTNASPKLSLTVPGTPRFYCAGAIGSSLRAERSRTWRWSQWPAN